MIVSMSLDPEVPAATSPASRPRLLAQAGERAQELLDTLRHWPWFATLRTLRLRFREDRLGLTASSLTFTTLIALVPLLTVVLAVFTAFPMFASFESALDRYFLQNLVPEAIARPVMRALNQFAAKARGLGTAGLLLLVATALALVLTIDKTLNGIWRVRRVRPLAQRVLIYWAVLTLGPLVLGVGLSLPSLLSASGVAAGAGVAAAKAPPGLLGLLLNLLEFSLLWLALAGLFRYVPNTPVRWTHALAGAGFATLAIEIAKVLLAWYVTNVPVYTSVYGAFATVPILLLWTFTVWLVVLFGAVIAAYAPSLKAGLVNRDGTVPGQRFDLALALLRELHAARVVGAGGVPLHALAGRVRTDPLQVEPVLEVLASLGWAARLDEEGEPRHVMLCEPAGTPIAPLADLLLLAPGPNTARLRARLALQGVNLAEAL